jgi:hypothetical protein
LFLTEERTHPHDLAKVKIPFILFPAADPVNDFPLETATPHAVEVQEAYVYLFLVVLKPNAKIPRVLFPAAEPAFEIELETATPEAVDVQDE